MKNFNGVKRLKQFLMLLFLALGSSTLNAQTTYTETITHESFSLACDGCVSVRLVVCYETRRGGLGQCIISDTRGMDEGDTETFSLTIPAGATMTSVQFQFVVGGGVINYYDVGTGGEIYDPGSDICSGTSCGGDLMIISDSGTNTLFRLDAILGGG